MSPSSAVTPEMIRRGVFRQRGNLTQSESASQFAEPDLSQGYDPAHVADASAREPTLPARYSLATVGDASVDQSGPSLKSRILAGLSAGLTGLGQTFDASAGGAEGFLGSMGQGYSNTQDAMYGTPGEQMARQIRSQALGRQDAQDQQAAEYSRAQIAHLNAQTQHDLEPAKPARQYQLPKSPEERSADAAEWDRQHEQDRLHPRPTTGEPPGTNDRRDTITRWAGEYMKPQLDKFGDVVQPGLPAAEAWAKATADYDAKNTPPTPFKGAGSRHKPPIPQGQLGTPRSSLDPADEERARTDPDFAQWLKAKGY